MAKNSKSKPIKQTYTAWGVVGKDGKLKVGFCEERPILWYCRADARRCSGPSNRVVKLRVTVEEA